MTRIAVFVAAWAMAAGMAFGAPRVGTSVALCGPKYPGDEVFKERPVCAEYERHGLDMHVMTPLKKGEDVLRRFHDFHVVWLMVEHEAYPNQRGNVLDPDEVGKALAAYVAAGGGLVIQHSPGRYPEAGADKYWDTAFAHLGMTRLHEEIVDLANATNWGRRMIFHTDRLKPHPVTDGVPGLWLAARNDVRTGHGGTWGTHAIVYSPEWETVVETAPTAKSYCKDKDTNVLDYGCVGRFTAGGPVVAVRTLGKGRVVSIGIHKDNGAWMYGIDTWPNVTERGEVCGRRTDTVKLVENALKWAAEPAEAIAGFTDGAKPFLRNAEPYVMSPVLGNLPPENRRWKAGAPWKFPKGVEGVIGLHSSLSDGESSVAEYAAEARRLGLGFIVFTDPLAALGDDAKLKRLREECAAASSEDLYVCPGVEYVDLDGLEWMQHHERVAFPDTKPLKLDGGTYERFKNGVVTQRNNYGGHQNLYRGAIINTERLAEAGVHPVNLAYFNSAIPRAYEVDRLVHDNERAMLGFAPRLFRYAPESYTRVKRASDLARAAVASATHVDSVAAAKDWLNVGGGWNGWGKGEAAHAWVRCGAGIAIEAWGVCQQQGTEFVTCSFVATADSGIDEALVYDGDRGVIARFGGKDSQRIEKTFTFPFSHQAYPQLLVRAKNGAVAWSNNKWVYYYHAGLHRCGDNSNLQSPRPGLLWFANWDDALVPLAKAFHADAYVHFHRSEAHDWDNKLPSAQPTVKFRSCGGNVPVRVEDFPGKGRRPSSETTFSLMQPAFGAIIDQSIGDWVASATHSDVRSTYANCSTQRREAENPWWRRHHRVYQMQDRIDTGWIGTHDARVNENYRGGYTVVEGDVRFLKDVELAEPLALAWPQTCNPLGEVAVYRSAEGKTLRPGDWAAIVPSAKQYYAFVALKGSDDLGLEIFGKGHNKDLKLTLGTRKTPYVAGTTLKYRFAVLTLTEDPHDGAFVRETADFISRIDGILTLNATDGAVAKTFKAKDFIQDLPIRVKGLVDNGTAVRMRGNGAACRPFGFCDGLAYTEIPLEDGGDWWFGNLFLADDPELKFCFVPAMAGHPKATLEIRNSTARDITTTVRDVRSNATFTVTVPAGDLVTHELVQ